MVKHHLLVSIFVVVVVVFTFPSKYSPRTQILPQLGLLETQTWAASRKPWPQPGRWGTNSTTRWPWLTKSAHFHRICHSSTAQCCFSSSGFPCLLRAWICQVRKAAGLKSHPTPTLGEGAYLKGLKTAVLIYFHVFMPSFPGKYTGKVASCQYLKGEQFSLVS